MIPASGPITMAMVAAELGIGLPLSLGDARVRALAGVPSGPISMGQLRGKSALSPLTATTQDSSGNADGSFADGTISCFPSVTASGGSGGYTYAWSFTSNPNGCSLSGSTNATCNVWHPYARYSNGGASATLQCVITDSGGRSITKTGIGAQLTWASQASIVATTDDGYGDADSSFGGGTASCSPSVTASGGSGGYTYLWSFTSNPSGCVLASSTSASCRVSRAYARYSNGGAIATLQCVVTDSQGNSITKTDINAQLSWTNGNL